MPYMTFGQNAFKSICQKILNRELAYENTVIIGDNSSGKSLLLKMLINSAGETENIYFIDAVNRVFSVREISKDNGKLEYSRKIIDARIREDYFNIRDSFNCYGTWTEKAEQIYLNFEKEVQDLFEKLTEERFEIVKNGVLGEVQFKAGRGLLSSGYQAIIRIILEVLFYQRKYVEEHNAKEVFMVIDELDEFLSPKYAARIFEFLKEEFPEINFVVTTHSCDLIANAADANFVILENAAYEVRDINDYNSVSEVQIVFDRVFGIHEGEEGETDRILQRLFNNKISKAWSQDEQMILEKIQKKNLTASQQLICRQIMEW